MVSTQNQCSPRYKQSQWRRLLYLLLVIGGGAGLPGNAMADIQVMSTFKQPEVIGTQCSGGSTLSAAGLTWTCPLTKPEADAAGIGYQLTYTELSKTWVRMNWSTASSYCQSQGYRLPTKNELTALYGTMGNMSSAAGWPVYNTYWSSTPTSASTHNSVYLSLGAVSNDDDSVSNYVTCIR